jgi:hypothetical protein
LRLYQVSILFPPKKHKYKLPEGQHEILYSLDSALSIIALIVYSYYPYTSFEKVNSTLKIGDVEISFAKSMKINGGS